MKRVGIRLALGSGVATLALAIAAMGMAQQHAPDAAAGPLQEPQWAYAIPGADAPEPVFPKRAASYRFNLPGAKGRFTVAQIGSSTGPADWYPEDHPAMPPIVAKGDASRGIMACALCHYPNGKGRPENAGVSGLSRAYFIQTMKDMKAGLRHSAEPQKRNAGMMAGMSKAMTDAEIEAAADYYAAIKWTPWIRVVETETVAKHRPGGHALYYPLTGPAAGVEPIAGRIIETPEKLERSERLRDPRSGFVAYVPPGAVEAGRLLVEDRGCASCHGQGLVGQGLAPSLFGRSPSYIARQLNDYKQGARKGPYSAQMEIATSLKADEITSVAAYIASLPPPS